MFDWSAFSLGVMAGGLGVLAFGLVYMYFGAKAEMDELEAEAKGNRHG